MTLRALAAVRDITPWRAGETAGPVPGTPRGAARVNVSAISCR
jgi:hypothetical protein